MSGTQKDRGKCEWSHCDAPAVGDRFDRHVRGTLRVCEKHMRSGPEPEGAYFRMVNRKIGERGVRVAAVRWWVQKRPASFTVAEHLENPTVNTTTVVEEELANAVARYVKRNTVRLKNGEIGDRKRHR